MLIIRISWTVSPNHGGAVDPSAVVRVTLSEPPDPATVTDTAILLKLRADNGQPSPVAKRLAIDGATITITAEDELLEASVYEVEITSELTDRQGLALEGAPFLSDFTTSGVFHSANLAPNTLWVTVPERQDGSGGVEVAPDGELGAVMVCGAAALALPGTLVDVTHYNYGDDTPSGTTATVSSTDADGNIDPNTNCTTILSESDYEGRCLTEVSPGEYQPGSFCVAFDNVAAGDRFLIGVEDAFGNRVEIDAGNMRDERTGAEIIGPNGGTVTFAHDASYRALIPRDAFERPTLVEIQPIEASGSTTQGVLFLDDASRPEFAALEDLVNEPLFDLIGSVDLRLTPNVEAAVQFDITVPALADADPADQYYAVFTDDFDGSYFLTPIDTAFFDDERCAANPEDCIVQTDPVEGYAGLTMSGTFGIVRSTGCTGSIVGYTYQTTAAGLVETDQHSLLFRSDGTKPDRYTFPVPCNTPVTLTLTASGGAVVDVCSCTTAECLVGFGAFAVLDCRLSDDVTPPLLTGASVLNGSENVDPTLPTTVSFSEAIDSENAKVEVKECGPSGRVYEGREVWSADRKTLTFVPTPRLPYAECFEMTITAPDDGGNLVTDMRVFHTFEPRVIAHIPMDARDVAVIPSDAVGDPEKRYIAVAEGDAVTPGGSQVFEHEGGVRIYEVSNLTEDPVLVSGVVTAGADRALEFVSSTSGGITTVGASGGSYSGPFLISVDGPGGPGSFGALRIYDLSAFPQLTEVATRFVNFSTIAINHAGVTNPAQSVSGSPATLQDLLRFVPVDTGVPLDVASFGTDVFYVANAPHIGLQAIVPEGMNSDPVVERQVDGTLRGDSAHSTNSSYPIRSVDTVIDPIMPSQSAVVALLDEGSQSKLLLVDPELVDTSEARNALIRDEFLLDGCGRANSVTVLPSWPVFQPQAQIVEQIDLVTVACELSGVRVVPLAAGLTGFEPYRLENGEGVLRTPGGNPMDIAGDSIRQELFVADGTAGLAIVDLRVAGGAMILQGDRSDRRVLGTLDLQASASLSAPGAIARSVANLRSENGWRLAVVAAGESGVFVVHTGPGSVMISGSEPSLSHICAGCEMQFFAITDPPGVSVTWELADDLGGNAVISPQGYLQVGEDAPRGDIRIRARLASDPTHWDETVRSVFQPPAVMRVPLYVPGEGVFDPILGETLDPAVDWLLSDRTAAPAAKRVLGDNPKCADDTKATWFGANQDASYLQLTGVLPSLGRGDGTPRNAAYHALANCRFARVCGVPVASEFWTAWEEHMDSRCFHASMDLHNNKVGRELSAQEGSCRTLVADALAAGRLRWLGGPGPGAPDCRSFDRKLP